MTREFEWNGAGLASGNDEVKRLREENEMLKGGARGASSRWKEIGRLRQRVAELETAKKLCRSDFEKWISTPPYEHMCDRNSAESAWPGQYKRYETQLAWEAWQQALSIDAAMEDEK